MLIATNRRLNSDRLKAGVGALDAFGEDRGSQLRLARVTRDPGDKWRVHVVAEGQEAEALERATTIEPRSWVLYVHGNNKTFGNTLEQAAAIEARYEVEVVVFSWPSFTEHPAGQTDQDKKINAYRNARAAAESSVAEFGSFLKLCRVLFQSPSSERPYSVSLFAHSMGNYLVQNYVQSKGFEGCESRFLANVVLSQADVDSEGHQLWLKKLFLTASAVYVTINRHDDRLDPAQQLLGSARLGNTRACVAYPGIAYVDVTEGTGVEAEHTIWGEEVHNDAVKSFFSAVLSGQSVFAPAESRWGSIVQLFAD